GVRRGLAPGRRPRGRVTSAFLRDTAVEQLDDGSYRGRVSAEWFTPRGANGGFLAAVVLRAIMAAESDVARAPRSLTLHYLRPPSEGEVRVTVNEERRGGSVTTYSARMEQDGRLCVLALAALSQDFASSLNYVPGMPDVPPPNG